MSQKTYDTLESKGIFECPLFSIVADKVKLPTQRVVTRYTVRHPGAVVIVPQLDDKTLVLIRQYRHSISREILEFPAGTLEPGESPECCAKREIVEEIGYAAKDWTEMGMSFPAPGFVNEVHYWFHAKGLYRDSADGDEDEIIEVVPMSIEAVEKAIASGEIVDGKTAAIFARARFQGLF